MKTIIKRYLTTGRRLLVPLLTGRSEMYWWHHREDR